MTDGQHREAVKHSLDKLMCMRNLIDEQRGELQQEMMDRYDKRFKELRGMKQGDLHSAHTKKRTVSAHRRVGPGANGGTHRAHSGLEGTGHTSDPFSGSAFLFFGILSGGG